MPKNEKTEPAAALDPCPTNAPVCTTTKEIEKWCRAEPGRPAKLAEYVARSSFGGDLLLDVDDPLLHKYVAWLQENRNKAVALFARLRTS